MKIKTVCNAIGIAAILVGLLLVAGVFFAIDFDFSRLNSETYQRGMFVHNAQEELNEIEINTSFFDVKILPMVEEEEMIVYYPYSENIRHEIHWADGKLSIDLVDGRAWYEKWSIADAVPENTVIEVHLPHRHYEKLKILSGGGDVSVTSEQNREDVLSFGNVSVETGSGNITFTAKLMRQDTPYNAGFSSGSGDVYLSGVQCVPVNVKTESGDITLRDCVSSSSFRLRTSSGEVDINNVTSAEGEILLVSSDTGDVKLFQVIIDAVQITVDTGDVELSEVIVQGDGRIPNSNTLEGGDLRIEVDTGEIDIARSDAKSLWIETDTGDVEIELLTGKVYTVKADTGDVKHPEHDPSGGTCHVSTDTGDVRITVVTK